VLAECPEGCDASCYRCLRSFRNKLDHRHLDRRIGEQLLRSVLEGKLSGLSGGAGTGDARHADDGSRQPTVGRIQLSAQRRAAGKGFVASDDPNSGHTTVRPQGTVDRAVLPDRSRGTYRLRFTADHRLADPFDLLFGRPSGSTKPAGRSRTNPGTV
jgi:hypothetical protein